MRHSFLTSLLFPLALVPMAQAEPAAPVTSELAIFSDVPVVLSAARLIQPLRDVPGAVTVIDHDMIRASGARDVAELLRFVPGFQIGRASGATPLTTYHGLSDDAPRRMLVRVDGRSAYSPYFVSGIEWAKISVDIDDIERIEVFRGSNAAAYGSNAFLGIVNIITRPAADTPAFRTRITEGANGLHERVVSIRQRLGEATARLTLGQTRDDGVDPVEDSVRHRRVDARVDWQLTPEDELEFHFGFVGTRADAGIAGEVTDPPRQTDSDTGFGQIRWRHQLGVDDEFNLTYFHQEERFDDPGFFLPSLSTYLIDNRGLSPAEVAGAFFLYGIPANAYVDGVSRTRALRDDIEFEHRHQPAPRTRLVWGAGLRSDRVRSARIFSTDDDIAQRHARLFANVEQQLPPHWTVNAGAMLEDTNTAGPRLSPRLAVNAHLGEHTTARVAWSRGYRNLTPFERRADVRYSEALSGVPLLQVFQPSGDLSPERVTTREVGLRHESDDGHSHIDVRVFDERVRDMLRRTTTPSNITPLLNRDGESPLYLGDGEADIRGAEVSTLYRSAHDTWIGGHYAYTDINSNDPDAHASAPRQTFSFFAAIGLPHGWHMSASHAFVGSMHWYDDDEDARVPAHHASDLRLAKTWQFARTRTEVAVGMERISGAVADYLPSRTRPTQGYVTLRLSY